MYARLWDELPRYRSTYCQLSLAQLNLGFLELLRPHTPAAVPPGCRNMDKRTTQHARCLSQWPRQSSSFVLCSRDVLRNAAIWPPPLPSTSRLRLSAVSPHAHGRNACPVSPEDADREFNRQWTPAASLSTLA